MPRRQHVGLVLTIFAVGLAIGTLPARGQTISLFRQFSDPKISSSAALAADPSGIYVIGWPADCEAAVGKYDYTGTELWTRKFTVPLACVGALRAAVDATGLYVLASNYDHRSFQNPQFLLRKFSEDGDELWSRYLEFEASGGLTTDGSGIYVAGVLCSSCTLSYLTKYSPGGAELWTSRFDASRDYPVGVAADPTGVYVIGRKKNVAVGQLARKWDARGNQLWTREVNPTGFAWTIAAAELTGFYALAWDSSGKGPFLYKYDSEGTELWSRMELEANKIAVDSSGVYLVGETNPVSLANYYAYTSNPSALPGQCRSGWIDSFVRRFSPDGEVIWTRQFGAPQGTWARGVVVDDSGVYVIGAVHADAFAYVWERAPEQLREELEPPAAFFAKFEKSPTVVTGSGPRIFPGCIVNAASYIGGGVAPGEMVTIFGSGIGPSEPVQHRLTEKGTLATTLADTRVLFNGIPAPLLYVSDKQSNAIVPYALAGRSSVEVQIEYRGVRSELLTLPVLASRPGIFSVDSSGSGQGLILNEDGSLNSASNPARRGSIIRVYATGGGEAASGIDDGQFLSDVLPQTSLPVSVFFDLFGYDGPPTTKADVLYAGGVSGAVAGLLQINIRVPNAYSGKAVPFFLMIGSHWTVFQVTVALE